MEGTTVNLGPVLKKISEKNWMISPGVNIKVNETTVLFLKRIRMFFKQHKMGPLRVITPKWSYKWVTVVIILLCGNFSVLPTPQIGKFISLNQDKTAV